jgi:4-hydroxybenzoate polyprenyltransferase
VNILNLQQIYEIGLVLPRKTLCFVDKISIHLYATANNCGIFAHIPEYSLKKYLSFIKIEHTLFSLPMIYSGVFLASHEMPPLSLLLLVLSAAVGARIVAMTLNRIIDREIDKRNPRTVHRELASGKMNLREGYGVLLFGFTLYIGSAALISDFCLHLSPIPLAVFVIYPYLKRFTPLAHFGVGFGLAMAPLGGYFAVTGTVWRSNPVTTF